MVKATSKKNYEIAKKTIETGLAKIEVPEVSYKIKYSSQILPAVMNDSKLFQGAKNIINSRINQNAFVNIDEIPPFFGEDFAFYLQKIPGIMFFLGVSNPDKGIAGMPHTPQFAVDEDAINFGARSMAAVILDYLKNH
jgi:metal-dependent amidase/aminoacylase/carboxypeptidase family protein